MAERSPARDGPTRRCRGELQSHAECFLAFSCGGRLAPCLGVDKEGQEPDYPG